MQRLTRHSPIERSTESFSSDRDPVAENVEAIVALHNRADQRVSRHQRIIETWTAYSGRPFLLFTVLTLATLWIIYNSVSTHFHRAPIDPPPFYWLQGCASLGGFLIAITVLITQNRQGKLAERRAQLDLQINLVSEAKITKIIALLEELRRDLPSVQNRHDPEAQRMQESVDPHAVIAALEEQLESEAIFSLGDSAEQI